MAFICAHGCAVSFFDDFLLCNLISKKLFLCLYELIEFKPHGYKASTNTLRTFSPIYKTSTIVLHGAKDENLSIVLRLNKF